MQMRCAFFVSFHMCMCIRRDARLTMPLSESEPYMFWGLLVMVPAAVNEHAHKMVLFSMLQLNTWGS